MISITPAHDQSSDFKYPMIDRENEQSNEKEQAAICSREPAANRVEFDLFAEARQIYAKARAGRRVRSSSII
jgi:hypothetical protein